MRRTSKSPQESLDKAFELVQQAIALDDSHGPLHGYLGMLYADKREYGKALAEGERAIALNPSDSLVHAEYGMILIYVGRPQEAIPVFQKAIRLNPFCPSWYYNGLGGALRSAGRFEEAVSAYKKKIQLTPNDFSTHVSLAGTYSMMGRESEAQAEAIEVLRINPKFSLDNYAKTLPPAIDQSQRDKYIDALRKAGLK